MRPGNPPAEETSNPADAVPTLLVAAHLAQMIPETVIAGVILETGLELPCLIIKSELVDVSDLGGGVAVAGLGLDLILAHGKRY